MLPSTFLFFWRRLNVRTRIMEMARKKITKNERPATKPADVKVNLEGARPKITRTKKVLFSAVTVLGFFALVELGLWMAGAPTLIDQEDPFRGFSGLVKVFQREGPIYRTEPATRGSTFNDQSFLAQKPSNGLRIFCLGGSSSYGFPWGAEAAFTSIVGEALAATHPERQVEAVNASGVSYAMHRMNIVADELLAYKPDIFLVYEGHNEFIEPSFFAALKHRSTIRTRLEYATSYSRLCSSIRSAAERLRGPQHSPVSGFETRVLRDQSHLYSPQEKEAIVAEFRWRLERLVGRARGAGVKVVLATVPCNLRQWRPEASTTGSSLTERDRQRRSDLFVSGSRLLKSGRFELAAADLDQAARIAPHHAETQFLLGQAYEGLGRFDDARSAYQRACDQDASPIRRLSGINSAIREIAHQQGALLVDVDRFFEQQSEHGLVGFNLIEDYVHPTRQGHELIAWQIWEAMEGAGWFDDKPHAEKAIFDRILAQRRPRTPENNAVWFYNQGVVLEKQGQVDAAIKSYRQAVRLSPHNSSALLNLGKALVQTRQFAEAATNLQEALRIQPDLVEAHNNLGTALLTLGRSDDAVAHYQEALRIRPDYAPAHFNLGAALAAYPRAGGGRVEEAIAHYQKALEINPDLADAHSNLGLELAGRGKFEEAMAHYQKALEIDPDHADAHNNLGLELARRGQGEEAIAHYQKALEIKPDHAEAHNNLGLELAHRGKVEEAIVHYQKALEIKPDYAYAHFYLGNALARRGQGEQAIAHFQKALEINPNSAEFHLNLGVALAGSQSAGGGHVEEAIAHYQKALEIRPDYANAHFYLGLVLASRGQADEAVAHYQKALEIKPDFLQVHFNLGNVLAGRGKADEAIAHFQRALSLASAQNDKAQADLIQARIRRVQSGAPADGVR